MLLRVSEISLVPVFGAAIEAGGDSKLSYFDDNCEKNFARSSSQYKSMERLLLNSYIYHLKLCLFAQSGAGQNNFFVMKSRIQNETRA